MSAWSEYEEVHQRIHEELRAMYRRNGTDKPLPGDPEYKKLITCTEFHDYQLVVTHGNPDRVIADPAGKKKEENAEGKIVITASQGAFPEIPGEANILQVPRVGDADRDKILERLREAYGEGYLSLSEQGARIDAAVAARTQGQLDVLVQDLPARKKEVQPEKKEEEPRFRMPLYIPVITASVAGFCAMNANFSTGPGAAAVVTAVILALMTVIAFMAAIWERLKAA